MPLFSRMRDIICKGVLLTGLMLLTQRPASSQTSSATPVFWPPQQVGAVYVDGSSFQAVGLVRAVANPTRVTVGVGQKFFLGARPVEAFNGRGERVGTSALPHPSGNVLFQVFTNPAGYPDHTGYVDVVLQQSPPTAQVYLVGRKAGKVVVRCFPLVNIDDAGTKMYVYLRHVYADIEVEVK